MSKSTAHEYRHRLDDFKTFITNEYAGLNVDNIIDRIKDST